MDKISDVLAPHQNCIPVALATDENYAMPTAVAITSILENAAGNTFYDFHILTPVYFPSQTSRKIALIKYGYPNCNINFIGIKASFDDALIRLSHITKPTYYRLLLGDLLPQYDKCIYLDSDTVVCTDLTEFFSTDLDGYYLGGIKDFDFNDPSRNHDERRRDTGLCIENNYINAGVLLMNLKAIRRDGMTEAFLSEIKKEYLFQDQDILNITCLDKIKHLPVRYNLMSYAFSYPDRSPHLVYSREELDDATSNPAIIHFAAHLKPWLYYGLEYSGVWHRYFCLSIFRSQPLNRKNGKLRVLNERILSKANNCFMLVRVFFRYQRSHGLRFALRKSVRKTRKFLE